MTREAVLVDAVRPPPRWARRLFIGVAITTAVLAVLALAYVVWVVWILGLVVTGDAHLY